MRLKGQKERFITENCGIPCLPLLRQCRQLKKCRQGSTTIRVPALSPWPPCSLRCASQFAKVACRLWRHAPLLIGLVRHCARGSFGPAHAGTGELSLQGCALHGFGVCDDRRCVFCVSICVLPTGCRAKPCSVWAKPTTNLSPSPRERGRGSRGKGAHCLASLTHVFKLMPLPSGEGKSPSFDAMSQLFVKSPFSHTITIPAPRR